MRLGSGVAMAVVQDWSYSSDSTSSLGISICRRCSHQKNNNNNAKNKSKLQQRHILNPLYHSGSSNFYSFDIDQSLLDSCLDTYLLGRPETVFLKSYYYTSEYFSFPLSLFLLISEKCLMLFSFFSETITITVVERRSSWHGEGDGSLFVPLVNSKS